MRGGPLLLACKRERVLISARNIVRARNIFRGLTKRDRRIHGGQPWIDKAPANGAIKHLLLAAKSLIGLAYDIRRAAHGLNAARDHDVARARLDHARGKIHGLKTRRAQAIHGRASNGRGKTRQQRGHARDIAIVLARLVGRTKVDILNKCGINASARNNGANDMRGQVVGTHASKRAPVTTNGCSKGGNNGDSAGHASNLPQVSPKRRRHLEFQYL